MKSIGKWSRQKFEFPKAHGFEPPVPVEVEMPRQVKAVQEKIDKRAHRNQIFSEQHCVWKLPSNYGYDICDAIRVNDDLLLAASRPQILYHCKDFLNSDMSTRLQISEVVPSAISARYRLAYLGGDNVLLHEETHNYTAIISLPDQMVASVKQDTSITGTLGAFINGTNYPWRMSNQKSNHALLYQCGGHKISVYTDDKHGVTVQNGSVPFHIKRIYSHAPQQWTIVSTDNKNFQLKLDNGNWTLDKIETNIEGGIDTIATKPGTNGMTMIADPYYYIESNKSGNVSGILRKVPEKTVSSRDYHLKEELIAKNDFSREAVFLGNTIVRAKPRYETPKEYVDDKIKPYETIGFLETIDTDAKKICYVPVPIEGDAASFSNYLSPIASIVKAGFHLVPWDDDNVLTVDSNGYIRSFELQMSTLGKSFNDWKRMTSGADDDKLRLEFDRSPDDVDFDKLDEPKLGKIDPNNAPHHGGNQWMGGTGGYNTAGMGGIGGPFRLDAGHDVHQMPDFAKQQVPKHILQKARDIAKVEYAKKLREINMSEHDADAYDKVWKKVQVPSRKLASVIDQLEAKKKEREWTKHQTSGDLDDGKLIEGVTGEQNIYRRRVDKEPDPGAPQTKPKRLRLCLDVSGSMYRFNGFDQRLIKTMEAALMTMTALDGKTDKVKYDIHGHSGDSPCVSFVNVDQNPKNDKKRLDILKKMIAHTQYCVSGDNTVECLQYSVNQLAVKKDDFDETVVVLVSDANLQRYGIRPYKIKDAMLKDPSINTFVILIGSLGNEADMIQKELPAGKAFVLKDTSELPKIMETIFASTIAQ